MKRMNHCSKCDKKLTGVEEKRHCSNTFCEDCYIEVILENARKAPYLECGHSFMLRLKPGFDNRRLSDTDRDE